MLHRQCYQFLHTQPDLYQAHLVLLNLRNGSLMLCRRHIPDAR